LAAKRNISNVRFEVADVYRLPFSANSFDAALAHGVLMHLREPVHALVEIRRVLHPGGVAGVRDLDYGASLLSPMTPLLQEWLALRSRVREHHGRDSFVGRHHRRLFLDAGFARAEAKMSVHSPGSAGSLEETRLSAAIDAMMAEIDAWAERPDAFAAEIICETVGWAPG
jgi:SAM-dependent methyltransferase